MFTVGWASAGCSTVMNRIFAWGLSIIRLKPFDYSPEAFRLFAWGLSIIRLRPFDYSLEAFRLFDWSFSKICSKLTNVSCLQKKHVLLFLCLQKKHVLLFLFLQKNMFFCCESNKSTLLKPLPRFIYRLIIGYNEVLCNIWDIY